MPLVKSWSGEPMVPAADILGNYEDMPDYILFTIVLSRPRKRIYENADITMVAEGNKKVDC
jgi:hypothetical protein